MGTTYNELEPAGLMVSEIRTGKLQVNEVGRDINKCLTIRQELKKLFGWKESQQNQQLNKEMLEQTVRGTDSKSLNANQLWSYWEKPKLKGIGTAATRTMIQRMENDEKYFVELAGDQPDVDHDGMAKPHQRIDYKRALELAYNLGVHLNLKRKRDVRIIVNNEEEMKETMEICMQQPAMIVVSWNCRGMAAPSTVHELKSICKSRRPSLLFLMETKATKLSCDRIRRKLGFDNMFCVESRGLSGGLCIFWKSNVNIHVYAWCDNFIKTKVSSGNDKDWEAIFVYGHPDYKKRKELWKDLTFVNDSLAQPTVLIGDFNDVISQDEKVGLHPKPSCQIQSFRNFVHKNALLDMELQGMKYTWFSNPRNGCVTKERLDRVLVNWEWRRAFQHATLSALPPISSDHAPLVLDVKPRGRRIKSFKFEAFWVDHADCDAVIRRGWSSSGYTGSDHWENLNRRMQNCKKELTKWSRTSFKRADVEIENKWIMNMDKNPVIRNLDVRFVKDLIVEGEGWNLNKLKKYFDGASVDKIIRTPVSLFGREDRFSWPFRMDGNYTIKTGYYVARNEKSFGYTNNPSSSEDLKFLWQQIWKLRVPQKIRTFLWRASHNILPVFENLFNKRITNTPICTICLQEPETTEHALLLCPWTRAAWFGAQIQCCPTALTVFSFGKWLLDILEKMRLNTGNDYDHCSSMVGFLVWEVWKARNQAIYQKSTPNPIMVIRKAKLMELECAEMAEEPVKSSTIATRTGGRVTWRPPLVGWIKCNVDAAFDKASSTGATAAVFRDHNGTLLSGINSSIVATSPLAAEALAVRAALILSRNFQMQKVIIESDNQMLIQALKLHATIVEIQVILQDILHLVRGIPNCGFTWVPREANSLAHEVAKLTGHGTLSQNWIMHRPLSIRNILRGDQLAISRLLISSGAN
ncbi:hypothetical protein Ahy_B08g092996 [Arachis hypogaea]|uniref:RNase H type-1 domain-containing protein n=1 Tax=Arachis hypogaea TaxID=3818 RepID=A0A444Y520_ARAHY|nr:hypothetical protein Ahy_B08g092996 [Arachis hypogaea]